LSHGGAGRRRPARRPARSGPGAAGGGHPHRARWPSSPARPRTRAAAAGLPLSTGSAAQGCPLACAERRRAVRGPDLGANMAHAELRRGRRQPTEAMFALVTAVAPADPPAISYGIVSVTTGPAGDGRTAVEVELAGADLPATVRREGAWVFVQV